MKRRAIIFANGNLSDFCRAKDIINKQDFIICADGGTNHAFRLGFKPDVIIGDFDSLSLKNYRQLIKQKVECIKYPLKKDKTDFELAVNLALKRRFKSILIFGLLGDRIDHFLANIIFLSRVQSENKLAKIIIIEGNKELYILNKKIHLKGKIGDEVSIIPISERLDGIKTYGLQYKLDNGSLVFGTTRGVSNVMLVSSVAISIIKGTALVIHNCK